MICVPIGTGAMDISVATLAWQRARKKGSAAGSSLCEAALFNYAGRPRKAAPRTEN